MAHFPKPFFRPARRLWYVQINGTQVNLGPDRTTAFKAYHGVMQQRPDGHGSATPRRDSYTSTGSRHH